MNASAFNVLLALVERTVKTQKFGPRKSSVIQ